MNLEYCTPSDIPEEILQICWRNCTDGCWKIWKNWILTIRNEK